MGTTILRLDSASAINGDLHQMDSADEQWIAYQAGLRIADYLSGDFLGADLTSAPYALGTGGSGNNIGTYTDTIETAADSADPSSITTTNTITYQRSGVVSLSADRRYPVEFVSGTPNQLTEMDSSEVTTIAGRLKEYLFDSDNHWAGIIKLGSSAPSAEYTLMDSAFGDTIGNPATTTAYNFYVKSYVTSGDSASIPTESRPVSLKRSSGLTGTFEGIQEMNDSDIGETFGRAVMSNVVATSNGIGTYQLRSATQGAPTATGTWKSMGTATDTRRTVTAVANFTRTRVSTYDRTRTSEYSADYTRTRTSQYTRTSTRTRTSQYTRTSTRTRVSTYARTRATNYTRTSSRTSTRTSTRVRTSGSYSYTGNFGGNYIGNFTGDFVGNFVGNYARNFAGNFVGNYTRDFAGNYVGNYSRDFIGNYVGNYSRDFIGNYTRDFVGNYSRNVLESGSSQTIETYTLYLRCA